MPTVYAYGSTEITVAASGILSILSDEPCKVYQKVGYPNHPDTWDLLATTTGGTEYISSAFSAATDVRIEAGGADASYSTSGSSIDTEAVTAANTITAAESGKTFFLNSATGFASTLPAPAAGLKFKFIVTTQPTSGNCTVVTNGSANVIEGMADVNSTLVLAANEDSINFVASTTIVGDWVSVESDGTSWFVTGQSGAVGGITFTAA